LVVRFQPTPLDGWGRVWKRGCDIFFSFLFLIALLPLLALLSLLVMVDSGFPVFYVSRRVGAYGRKNIPVLKFRTMVGDADRRKEDIASLSHRCDAPSLVAR
ncbi:sugar transferase, partial [Candidatus Peregrinibacteria bacterium]|nr:sugar transferase [Candidatus Peregrinibacteria bacterium]